MSKEESGSDGHVTLPVTLPVATSAAMRALGRALGDLLRAGDLVILSGGLGAGKTTLTQGIGEGLGVRGPVTSPTFVIARVHPPLPGGRGVPLVHADAYRLGSVLELDDLDLDTDTAASVTVVEWGEGLAEGLAADRLEISITPALVSGTVGLAVGPLSGGNSAGSCAQASGDPDDPAADALRAVRISAVGERWEGAKLPLATHADRL